MSKRRSPGDWVWLAPNSGFVGNSNELQAMIQNEESPSPCLRSCGDPDCVEWSTLWTEPDVNGKRYTLCHVSECQMSD